MRRIWVEPADLPGEHNQFILEGEAFHHAVVVSRFQIGEEFEIVSGQPFALRVCIEDLKKKSARLKLIGTRQLPEIRSPFVHLAVGVTKWATFEDIVEKSVELGVASVQPLVTDFSFIRSLKDWPENRTERLLKIVKSATEQCGRGPLMSLREPMTLQAFIRELNQKSLQAGLFAYEGSTQLGVRAEMARLKSRSQINDFWAVVGPTGGFSQQEVAFMQQNHYPPVTLGNQILRADTACFALISVIKYELGLMEGM